MKTKTLCVTTMKKGDFGAQVLLKFDEICPDSDFKLYRFKSQYLPQVIAIYRHIHRIPVSHTDRSSIEWTTHHIVNSCKSQHGYCELSNKIKGS